MNRRLLVGAIALTAMASIVVADDALKSGPQAGTNIPGAFHPTNLTGAQAGKKHCLVWQYGGSAVAMVFARGTSDNLTSLVKKLDKTKVNSFVVFLSDDEDLGDKVKALAEKEGIKKTVLAIDNVAGPKAYNVAKDAEVTVVLYNQRKVAANHAFKKGELNEKGINAVLADLPKIQSK